MRDYWMRCAEQAVEEGNVKRLIFCLGMAGDMMRLEHDEEIRTIPRRRDRQNQQWTGHPPL